MRDAVPDHEAARSPASIPQPRIQCRPCAIGMKWTRTLFGMKARRVGMDRILVQVDSGKVRVHSNLHGVHFDLARVDSVLDRVDPVLVRVNLGLGPGGLGP